MKIRSIVIRSVCICLCISMLASLMAFAADGKFRQDTDRNYLKYINGFADNTVRPDGILTRAQGAKMLYYVLKLDGEGQDKTFSDVPKSFWGYKAISALSKEGILNGYSGGVFKPDSGLTRAEFATIVARAIGIDTSGKTTAKFSDVKGHWAEASIAALTELSFIGGYGDGTFRPNTALTRAEAVKLINKAVGMNVDTSIEESTFSDLPKTHWAFYEIMSAASAIPLEVSVPADITKFDDIEYLSLSETDFAAKRDALIGEFASATTERKAEIWKELSAFSFEIENAIVMTSINVERDLANEKYKADQMKMTEAQNAMIGIYKAQYEALAAASDRDAVCAKLGVKFEELQKPTEAMDEVIIKLRNKETEYAREFNEFYNTPAIKYGNKTYSLSEALSAGGELYELGLDYYLENELKLNTIFDNLVKMRTSLANYVGAETYYDAAYSYREDSMAVFRKEVKKYIVPLFQKIYFSRGYNTGYKFPDISFLEDTSDMLDEAQAAIRDLSPQSRQILDLMMENGYTDLEPRKNKASGAFSAYLDKYNMSFLFMNATGGFYDINTFTHEFGHVLHNARCRINAENIALDVAETASTAMELLIAKRYDEIFGDMAEDAEKLCIYIFLSQIVDACMLDEFQTIIYKNPDLSPTERNTLYRELEKIYYGIDYPSSAHAALRKGLVWSNPSHIYQRPFYMIEYALASAVSLQIWEISKTDFDRAFETYMSILESRYGGFGIAALCIGAGLNSPFGENTMAGIAELVDELFKADSTADKSAA